MFSNRGQPPKKSVVEINKFENDEQSEPGGALFVEQNHSIYVQSLTL